MNDRPPDAMPPLTLDLFAAAADPEAARYRILGGLQRARDAFRRYHIYPHLGQLVGLQGGLRAVVEGAARVERSGAGPAVGVDWEAGRVVHAGPPAPLAVALGRWALPRIEEAVEEGRALYEFAAAHADLAAVGLVPAYRDEGFLAARAGDRVHVLRYHVSALTGADGRYRGLKTAPVDVSLDPLAPPQRWKAQLAEACPDLPTPALFRLDTDVDLPLAETLVPVAKRKLLGLVQAWGEA